MQEDQEERKMTPAGFEPATLGWRGLVGWDLSQVEGLGFMVLWPLPARVLIV